jgi:hypothetical protein
MRAAIVMGPRPRRRAAGPLADAQLGPLQIGTVHDHDAGLRRGGLHRRAHLALAGPLPQRSLREREGALGSTSPAMATTARSGVQCAR